MLYRAPSGFVNLDSARLRTLENSSGNCFQGKQVSDSEPAAPIDLNDEHHSRVGKGEMEDEALPRRNASFSSPSEGRLGCGYAKKVRGTFVAEEQVSDSELAHAASPNSQNLTARGISRDVRFLDPQHSASLAIAELPGTYP